MELTITEKISKFSNEIGEENYTSIFKPLGENDELGNSLVLMRENLKIKWKPFLKGRDYEQNVLKTTKDKTLERSERLEKWEDISAFGHTSHSIIIADRFVLYNLKPNKFTIEKNLFPLLKQLIGEKRNNIHKKT